MHTPDPRFSFPRLWTFFDLPHLRVNLLHKGLIYYTHMSPQRNHRSTCTLARVLLPCAADRVWCRRVARLAVRGGATNPRPPPHGRVVRHIACPTPPPIRYTDGAERRFWTLSQLLQTAVICFWTSPVLMLSFRLEASEKRRLRNSVIKTPLFGNWKSC